MARAIAKETIADVKTAVRATAAKRPRMVTAGKPVTIDHTTQSVVSLTIAAWRKQLTVAVDTYQSSAKALLDVVLLAREHGFDEEQVAEDVKASFLAAGCEEATAKARANDAKAILSLPEKALNGAAGTSVQTFAASMRKNAKEQGLVKGRNRKPKTPSAATGASKGEGDESDESMPNDPMGLATLRRALEQVRGKAGDNATALSILADVADLINDLAEELAAEA